MAHFLVPPSAAKAGYDVDNKLAPGSVWRIQIPQGQTREIALWGGAGLWIKSNNPGVLPNDGFKERPSGALRILKLSGRSLGTSMLEVGQGASKWIALQVQVVGASSVVAQPEVALSFNPTGPTFAISEQCAMPAITATATIKNITPDQAVALQYQWNVTLTFKGGSCAHAQNRTTAHTPITTVTTKNQLAIPFTQIRGGELLVKVTVRVGNSTLSAQSNGLKVVGTNPSTSTLAAAAPANTSFRKLMRLESGLRQFLAPECPLFSSDNLGGVGLCQLTSPAPTDDQVWSWKENLKAGVALWNAKETNARAYPEQVRKGSEFKTLVNAYNSQRAATAAAAAKKAGAAPPNTPPIAVTLPDYTAEQLRLDTLRGFNGYAGNLHEYRVKVDSNGLLVVTLNATGTQGTAQWERVTAAERIAFYDKIGLAANRRGDPNYVDDVEKRASF